MLEKKKREHWCSFFDVALPLCGGERRFFRRRRVLMPGDKINNNDDGAPFL